MIFHPLSCTTTSYCYCSCYFNCISRSSDVCPVLCLSCSCSAPCCLGVPLCCVRAPAVCPVLCLSCLCCVSRALPRAAWGLPYAVSRAPVLPCCALSLLSSCCCCCCCSSKDIPVLLLPVAARVGGSPTDEKNVRSWRINRFTFSYILWI